MMPKPNNVAIAVAALLGFLVGRVDIISPAYTADPKIDQLAVELGTLKARLTQLESRAPAPPTTRPAMATSDAIVAALQNDMATIKQVLQVSTSTVTLASPGALILHAGGKATLQAGGELILHSGSNATLQAGGALKFKGGSSMDLEAAKIDVKSSGIASIRGTTIDVNSGGVASIRGTTISLNNGSKPVAFSGGKTAGTSTVQLIVDGSSSVLVP